MSKLFKAVHRPLTLVLALFLLPLLIAACSTATVAVQPDATATVAQATAELPPTATAEATPAASPTPASTPSAFVDCATATGIHAAECAALVALYNSTGGPDWVDNSGWLTAPDPCTWSGITCQGGHVTDINLLYNNLAGPLPAELGRLSNLRVLGLWDNRLTGPLPPELGGLSQLTFIDISRNELTGELPPAWGKLAALDMLALTGNQLAGAIPAAWGDMTALQIMNLSYNRLSGAIPPELGRLPNLAGLYLSHNQLSGAIPEILGSASALYELDLSHNQLTGTVPEGLARLEQRSLWGNQLEGTIAADGGAPLTVDFRGVSFSAAPAPAAGIWPELLPAHPVEPGDPIWYAAPERLRFTFADPDLPPQRPRLGINLAAEGQLLVYPLAELARIDPLVAERIETLQSLVAEQAPLPAGEAPLLPVTNGEQMFHAQAEYLEGESIQGLRYITQYVGDPRPANNNDLFYTFQGFTKDGSTYVAAFFPLRASILPDEIAVDDWDAFNEGYAAYVEETTRELDALAPSGFAPDLTLLDELVTSLEVAPGAPEFGAETALLALPLVEPPAGLVYRAPDGIWRVDPGGARAMLTPRTAAVPAPDGAHAVYTDEEGRLWLIDMTDASDRRQAADFDLSWLYQWGDARTLLLGVWLAPEESEGAATGHVAALDIETGAVRVIDEDYLSAGRPALAPDGKTIAYDVSPFYPAAAAGPRLYHPDTGSEPFDVTGFANLDEQPDYLFNPAWSPDGTRLAWLWPTATGTRLVIFDLAGEVAAMPLSWQPAQFGALPPSPVWSPDGQWLALEVWANNKTESGLWLVAGDATVARSIAPNSSSALTGSGPVWVNAHQLAYVGCDENLSACENLLFDLQTGTTSLLELPRGSVVLTILPPVD